MGKLYRPLLRAMSRKPVVRESERQRQKRDWYDYATLVVNIATLLISAAGLALAFYVAYSSGIFSDRL